MNPIVTQAPAPSEPIVANREADVSQVAIIGCGYWGPNHIRNFNSVSGCKVAAAADLDQSRLSRIAETFPQVRLHRDYNRVLADPDVDAVVVATPTSTHYSVVREALLAGKHVLCEKPLCEHSEQGRELTDLADERQLVLMVGHVFLFSAAVEKLKQLIQSQELGKIYYLSSTRTNLGPIRKDVNAAYDLAA
ncbi:MAG TPA: Gfo/Idh/MocA family oxidoreductase, partial [Candidatus Angelobacter sp.]